MMKKREKILNLCIDFAEFACIIYIIYFIKLKYFSEVFSRD